MCVCVCVVCVRVCNLYFNHLVGTIPPELSEFFVPPSLSRSPRRTACVWQCVAVFCSVLKSVCGSVLQSKSICVSITLLAQFLQKSVGFFGCIRICIRICMYVYVCIHKYSCIPMYMCVCVCMCVCNLYFNHLVDTISPEVCDFFKIYVYIYLHVYVYMYVYTYIHIYLCICVCVCVRVRVCVQTIFQ